MSFFNSHWKSIFGRSLTSGVELLGAFHLRRLLKYLNFHLGRVQIENVLWGRDRLVKLTPEHVLSRFDTDLEIGCVFHSIICKIYKLIIKLC